MTDQPPADLTAEMSAVGAVLVAGDRAGDLARSVFAVCPPGEFYRPAHGELADLLIELAASGPVDAPRVLTELGKRGAVDRLGGAAYLHTLVQWGHATADPTYSARAVHETYRRRELIHAAVKAQQAAYNPAGDLALAAVELLDAAEGVVLERSSTVDPAPTVEDFLAVQTGYDWLVPGLIERGDRLMFTGGEGAGKSALLRQIAVACSAGINPVTLLPCEPCRVLLVDFENGRGHLQRQLAPLVALAKRFGQFDADRLRVESKPEGIDVSGLDDAGWLVDKVRASRPDLLILGPLYRLHGSALDKEDAARQITVVLDGIRARNRCALILEAHAGHGIAGQRAWRPAGSSLFMRWPEFGFGLKPDFKTGAVTVVPWRGPRDERQWPYRLRRGSKVYGEAWPWVEAEPDGDERWAS